MNLYLRYFDREVLVQSVDDAIDFLASIDEIGMNPALEKDIRDYAKSDVIYPKRYKIRPRVYFIVIKTEAETMQDFKDKKAVNPVGNSADKSSAPVLVRLNVPSTSSVCRWCLALASSSIVTPISLPAARPFRVSTAIIASLTI